MKKALSRVFSVIGLLIFAAGLFVFVTVIFSKNGAVPSFLGYSFLNVSTGSMTPAYPVGTVVIVKKVSADKLKPGDAISFYSTDPVIKGIPNTHRILSVNKDISGKIYFVTKGDHNSQADKYLVYGDKVIGRVQGSIGSLGKIINILKNKVVFFFLLIVPIAFILVFEFKNLTKVIKNKDEE